MPRFAVVGAILLLVGIVERDSAAGRWVLLAGVLSPVTVALVAWRLVHGALFAAGLWMIGLAGRLGSLPAGAAGHRYWPLLLGAGLLVLAWPYLAIRGRRYPAAVNSDDWAALGAILAAVVALAALYFSWRSAQHSRRSANAAEEQTTRQLRKDSVHPTPSMSVTVRNHRRHAGRLVRGTDARQPLCLPAVLAPRSLERLLVRVQPGGAIAKP
jgi:hypothetical protein